MRSGLRGSLVLDEVQQIVEVVGRTSERAVLLIVFAYVEDIGAKLNRVRFYWSPSSHRASQLWSG